MWIQFPDLTETSLYEIKGGIPPQTEFIFATEAPGYQEYKPEKYGFRAIAAMNNWWSSHHGEYRKITLWWKRNLPRQIATLVPNPGHYTWNRDAISKLNSEHTQGSGCGFKIAAPPLSRIRFYRFFTLLRMPLVVKPSQRLWLDAYNFRQFDTGTFATWWCNGWDPKIYTWEMEKSFWTERGISLDAREIIKPESRGSYRSRLARQRVRAGVEVPRDGDANPQDNQLGLFDVPQRELVGAGV